MMNVRLAFVDLLELRHLVPSSPGEDDPLTSDYCRGRFLGGGARKRCFSHKQQLRPSPSSRSSLTSPSFLGS
jgi:hypothetical protein